MKAVILAGGKGTRMGEHGEHLPKALLPINDVPLLTYQLRLLKNYGYTHVFVLTHHLTEKIEDHLAKKPVPGIKTQVICEKSPLGTAGAVRQVCNATDDDFLLLYGDIMLDMDLEAMLKFHRKNQATATLACHPNDHPFDSDLIETDENNCIVAFHNKPHRNDFFLPNLVNAAVSVLSPHIFTYIPPNIPKDFSHDVFPKMLEKRSIYAYHTAEYIKDIGTPERWAAVDADARSGKITAMHSKHPRPAVFLDRDGVLCQDVGWLSHHSQLELLPNVTQAVRILNKTAALVILVTNQPVVARGACTLEELHQIHHKLESLLGRDGAKLDAIYFCPHHPDRGFPGENSAFKGACQCRKPGIGMINKACTTFNIDLTRSFMIGDRSTDIACGKNAGIKTVAVRTGDGCKNLPSTEKPTQWCDSILDAAVWIQNQLENPWQLRKTV